MTRRHDPAQQFREAQIIAREHNMFIAERPGPKGTPQYLVFRRAAPNNVFIGKRGTVSGLRTFVERAAEAANDSQQGQRA